MAADDDEKAITRKLARKEAYDALEGLIAKFVALEKLYDSENTEVAVDAILLVGMQYIDDDGDRAGYVNLLPRNGWQPPYITAGLLAMASARVTAQPILVTPAGDE